MLSCTSVGHAVISHTNLQSFWTLISLKSSDGYVMHVFVQGPGQSSGSVVSWFGTHNFQSRQSGENSCASTERGKTSFTEISQLWKLILKNTTLSCNLYLLVPIVNILLYQTLCKVCMLFHAVCSNTVPSQLRDIATHCQTWPFHRIAISNNHFYSLESPEGSCTIVCRQKWIICVEGLVSYHTHTRKGKGLSERTWGL